MKEILKHAIPFILAALLALGNVAAARAGVTGQSGPYRVELATSPAVIPVGKVRMTLKITDSAGKPVEGAKVRALVKMPTMDMGEKETTATPAGEPGVYMTEAVFMMEGPYNAAIAIDGPQGQATVNIPLQTGQNTEAAAGGGFTPARLLFWLLVAALVIFTLYRMKRTGQRIHWRVILNRGTVSGLILLGVMFVISRYAVANWRREGAMTPIEAQAMEMSTPAPPGVAPVTLAKVEHGPVERAVRYTGQAVGYLEQDITPRVQGWITWMPYYVGDRVKAGQLLARLDTSQIDPQIAERQAALDMATQGVDVARMEYRQALADTRQAHSEVGIRLAALEEAEANLRAAREERANAEAELAAMQPMVAEAEAMLEAAKAGQEYWRQEIARQKALLERGAVSKAEYQRDVAEAAEADAKVRQAQARLSQAQAQVRAAESALRKAEAMLQAARSKQEQAKAELEVHNAHVRATQAAANATRQRIAQAQAGVTQAQASLSSATTTRGYAEIRALTDGVITQRLISPGVLVSPGQTILKVAQISPIRLQANVPVADLARIQVGARVVVIGERTPSSGASSGQDGAGKSLEARVTSIQPAVDPVARTGIVEAVVPNRDGRFYPGYYLVMRIATGRSESALRVPTRALRTRVTLTGGVLSTQTQSYVWVAEPAAGQANQFTVTPVDVRTGVSDGRYTEILSGLKEGQFVVETGHQYLKSGDVVADISAGEPAPAGTGGHDHSQHGAAPSEATVEVSSKGFTPTSVTLKAGVPARLTFIRKDERNCGDEILLPDYDIRRELPLNRPVTIEFTPRTGEVSFTCGMKMLRGKVIGQ